MNEAPPAAEEASSFRGSGGICESGGAGNPNAATVLNERSATASARAAYHSLIPAGKARSLRRASFFASNPRSGLGARKTGERERTGCVSLAYPCGKSSLAPPRLLFRVQPLERVRREEDGGAGTDGLRITRLSLREKLTPPRILFGAKPAGRV